MNNIYYESDGLLPYYTSKEVILNSYVFNISGIKFKEFERSLEGKFNTIYQNLNRFFNYDDNKFFLYFETIIKNAPFDELDIEINPKVIINCNRKTFNKLQEKISDKEIDFKIFERFNDLRKNFIENPMEFYDVKHIDEMIKQAYIKNHLALNVKDFKNKVLFFITPSVNEAELEYISRYLNQNIDYFEEIKIIEKEKINDKFKYDRLINMYMNIENKQLNFEMDEEIEYGKELKCLFDEGKEKTKYTKLIDLIIEKFDLNFDNKSVDLGLFVSDLEAQKYTFIQFNDELDLIVIDDNKRDYETDKAIKKFIFDNYLDIDRNINEVAELLSEYIEDHYQLFYNILIGYFETPGKKERYYEQVQNEIIDEDYMSLDKLLEYIHVSTRKLTIENEKYNVIVKRNYA